MSFESTGRLRAPGMGCLGRTRSRLFGSRFGRKQREIQFVFVPEDVERTVEPVSEDDVGARWRHRSFRTQKLNEPRVEGDGPVIVNLAGILKAEDVLKVDTSSGTMEVRQVLGMSKASVVVIDEEGLQDVVTVIDGGDVLFAQVFDETILMSAIRSLDTALSLRRVSVDEMDAESGHGLAEGC